ncbi:MAG: flagellar protein FlgN [Steroidobacteraceae bacterium]
MEAKACLQQFEQFVSEELDALANLSELLEDEHRLLELGRAEALQQVTAARESAMTRLLLLQRDRWALVRALGRDESRNGLMQVLRWCDPLRTLTPSLQRCATLAEKCRDYNTRNGALVAARMQRLERQLAYMTTGSASGQYDPLAERQSSRGQLLSTQL